VPPTKPVTPVRNTQGDVGRIGVGGVRDCMSDAGVNARRKAGEQGRGK